MILKESLRETGLETWLTVSQVSEYLALIGAERVVLDLATVTDIVQKTYACIPFQNLTMLTRPRHPPSPECIVADMLAGIGGLCTTVNPFICALLQRLGFQAELLMASMVELDCHIGIKVTLTDQSYWVDLGNGFPYLQPLPLQHQASFAHPMFSYQLLKLDSEWVVEQTVLLSRQEKVNQRFEDSPCHYSTFETMRQRHYTQASYGPFLTGIRINRWTAEGGFLLRDNLIWDLTGRRKVGLEQALNWLYEYFPQPAPILAPMLRESWSLLDIK